MPNQIARKLRNDQTIAEKRLWQELRQLRARGYHFRRQHPIDAYIVDFACLSHRIVIEVDGIQHAEPSALAADAARDAHLHWKDFTVLRFGNGDIANQLEGVVARILATLGAMPAQD